MKNGGIRSLYLVANTSYLNKGTIEQRNSHCIGIGIKSEDRMSGGIKVCIYETKVLNVNKQRMCTKI